MESFKASLISIKRVVHEQGYEQALNRIRANIQHKETIAAKMPDQGSSLHTRVLARINDDHQLLSFLEQEGPVDDVHLYCNLCGEKGETTPRHRGTCDSCYNAFLNNATTPEQAAAWKWMHQ